MRIMKLMIQNTLFALAVIMLGACCEDEVKVDTIDASTVVRVVDDYVDPRDGHVYKCVQIGSQIWMAENLSYYLEGGSYSGCYTWEEKTVKLSDVEIPSNVWAEIASGILNDPQYDWEALDYPVSTMNEQIELAGFGYMPYSVYMKRWRTSAPKFYLLVNQKTEAVKADYVGPIAKEHTAQAEVRNGNYSQTYGYLYSLDGAKAAVPDGWRLPSDNDWKTLEHTLGMSAGEVDKLNAWRGHNAGDYLKWNGLSGFNALFAGCLAYEYATTALNYIRLNDCCYFWTSEESVKTETVTGKDVSEDGEAATTQIYKEGIIRQLAVYSSQIWRGTTRLDNTYYPMAYSVRCVKDIP